MKSKLKIIIHQAIVNELTNKTREYENMLLSIKQSKNNDTKSSAGDKFETGREMMQIEIDKVEMQLNKANFLLESMNQLEQKLSSQVINLGSLVTCDTGIYYISVGYGSIKIDTEKYYAISVISPVGQLLLGKKKGDTINFNDRVINILNVE